MAGGTVGNPKAVVVLLEHARFKRDAARRARQLARSTTTERILDELTHYAEELEQAAVALEQRASALAETIARSRSLSADVKALVERAQARLEAMHLKKPKKPS